MSDTNTDLWFSVPRDLDKEAMLHVEGRHPKLVCRDWQWRAINLHPETNTTAKA